MPSAQLEIVEYDEAGNVTATYIETDKRVDVVVRRWPLPPPLAIVLTEPS